MQRSETQVMAASAVRQWRVGVEAMNRRLIDDHEAGPVHVHPDLGEMPPEPLASSTGDPARLG